MDLVTDTVFREMKRGVNRYATVLNLDDQKNPTENREVKGKNRAFRIVWFRRRVQIRSWSGHATFAESGANIWHTRTVVKV